MPASLSRALRRCSSWSRECMSDEERGRSDYSSSLIWKLRDVQCLALPTAAQDSIYPLPCTSSTSCSEKHTRFCAVVRWAWQRHQAWKGFYDARGKVSLMYAHLVSIRIFLGTDANTALKRKKEGCFCRDPRAHFSFESRFRNLLTPATD